MSHYQELTCNEVHALIDQFVEMKQRGENPSTFSRLSNVTSICALIAG